MDSKFKSRNVMWHHAIVTRARRQQKNQHRSAVIWFTGLSGSGKSTLANSVEARLHNTGVQTYVLDGDNVRHGLCGDLGFSVEDRKENIRRIAEVAKLFVEAGVLTFTAFISPFKSERDRARKIFPDGEFFEIYCKCALEICEERDVKGLYSKARRGEVKEFTGISSPYEVPDKPELVVNTGSASLVECTDQVVELLQARSIILSTTTSERIRV
jgi:adenylylsulfate kinase